MKTISKEKIYGLIPKINIILILTAVGMGIYLAMLLSTPYKVSFSSDAAPEYKFAQIQQPSYAFQEDIFKENKLFGGKKKAGIGKKSLLLIGVSLGRKNIAIIRNPNDNKDYYCSEGDAVGEYIVKLISKDKVVIEGEGNTLELTR